MSFRAWSEPHFKHQEPTRKKTKRQKSRAEAIVKKRVRAECVARDGYCMVATRVGIVGECRGRSVWSHLSGHRRSQTRGMAPERRHTTLFSAILCERHDKLEEHGKYEVIYHSTDYADGPVSWQPRVQKAA